MMTATSEKNIKNTFIFGALNENELKNDSSKKQYEDFNAGDIIMHNETYSFKIEDGMYMANFAYTPCSRVGNHLLFKGILNGNGHLIGHNCIVRTNLEGTKESWQTYVEARKKLKSVEDIFQANNCPCNFRVPKSALANMEKAALPSKLASAIRGWRHTREDEWVLVDLYRYPHVETICTGPLFSAISHISLKQSQEQSYLTNFRAFNFNGDKICITSAEVSTDLEAFEKGHKCTELCMMEMPSYQSEPIVIPDHDFDNLISHPISAPAFGDFHFWSREPMPAPPPYSEHPPPSAPPISFMLPSSPFSFQDDYLIRHLSIG